MNNGNQTHKQAKVASGHEKEKTENQRSFALAAVEEEKNTDGSSRTCFCPDKILSHVTKLSKDSDSASCRKSSVSCVARAEKNEAGEDVRVPLSGRALHQLPLMGSQTKLARPEQCNEREIVLVDKNQEVFSRKTDQQNKDQNQQLCGGEIRRPRSSLSSTLRSWDSRLFDKGCLNHSNSSSIQHTQCQCLFTTHVISQIIPH